MLKNKFIVLKLYIIFIFYNLSQTITQNLGNLKIKYNTLKLCNYYVLT